MGATSRKCFKESLSGGNTQDSSTYTDIRGQEATQRHDEKYSSFSEDDQLIEGDV
jgi:hypothetical protein